MTMTYGQFLIIFLIIPIIILAWIQRKQLTRREVGSIGVLATIAFLYTPIWDNYLVANEVWWYDEDLVLGITFFWVPFEEYMFFILQPIMVGLWLLLLMRWLPYENREVDQPKIRYRTVGILSVMWVIFTALLISGNDTWRYMSLILSWSIPPIMLQLIFGADILWSRGKQVFTAIASATMFLALADTLAIDIGIWTISLQDSTGVLLWGILPIEEFVFFLVTNILVVGGVTLLLDANSYRRLAHVRAFVQNRLPMIFDRA